MNEILEKFNVTIPAVDGKTWRWVDSDDEHHGVQYLGLGNGICLFKCYGTVEEENENDKEMPWTKRELNYHHYIKKAFVVGCLCYLSAIEGVWKVVMVFRGADDWTMFFATKEEAKVVQEKILNWLLS